MSRRSPKPWLASIWLQGVYSVDVTDEDNPLLEEDEQGDEELADLEDDNDAEAEEDAPSEIIRVAHRAFSPTADSIRPLRDHYQG